MKRARFPSRVFTTLTAGVGLYLTVGGCGSLAGNPEEKPKPKPGSSVTFALTDAPVEDARNVFVTVSALAVSLGDEQWTEIPLASVAEIDLLQLQSGKTTPLAALADLPAGTYTHTRLQLAADHPPRLIDVDGVEHALTIPSGNETGLKIATPFVVVEGEPLGLTIDFDLRKSIKRTGNGNGNGNGNGAAHQKYMMKPVLRLIVDSGKGDVVGKAADGATVCLYKDATAKDATNDCDLAENSAVVKDGVFRIAFVPSGTYALRLFPKDGAPSDREGIVVKAGESVDVGDLR